MASVKRIKVYFCINFNKCNKYSYTFEKYSNSQIKYPPSDGGKSDNNLIENAERHVVDITRAENEDNVIRL